MSADPLTLGTLGLAVAAAGWVWRVAQAQAQASASANARIDRVRSEVGSTRASLGERLATLETVPGQLAELQRTVTARGGDYGKIQLLEDGAAAMSRRLDRVDLLTDGLGVRLAEVEKRAAVAEERLLGQQELCKGRHERHGRRLVHLENNREQVRMMATGEFALEDTQPPPRPRHGG